MTEIEQMKIGINGGIKHGIMKMKKINNTDIFTLSAIVLVVIMFINM